MDAETILVLVLTAGIVALLAWFEINSRRNEAHKDSKSTPDQPSLESVKTRRDMEKESNVNRGRAA